MQNGDLLVLERRDGWPNGLAWILFGAAALFALVWLLAPHPFFHGCAAVCLTSAVVLLLWRRGVTVDRRTRTLWRWWGLARPGLTTWSLRQTDERSLQGFRSIRVEPTTVHDTWKTWRRGMYHVQVERPDDQLGPAHPLRLRLILDDEFMTAEAAWATARRVSAFMDLQMVAEPTSG